MLTLYEKIVKIVIGFRRIRNIEAITCRTTTNYNGVCLVLHFFMTLWRNGVIHFMVDWENVNNRGLKGYQYLEADDSVTIFYSAGCNRITYGELHGLIDSGCNLQLYRLVNARKDALDHYISSRIGELFGRGYEGEIAIVSKDKGYKSVYDYWEFCANPGKTILLQETIEACIALSKEKSKRKEEIKKNTQILNLENEYNQCHEYRRVRRALDELFKDTEYKNITHQIMSALGKNDLSKKTMYLNMVKQFGKKDGIEIYRILRQWKEDK